MLALLCLLPALAQAKTHQAAARSHSSDSGSFVDEPESVQQDVFLSINDLNYDIPRIEAGYEHSIGSKYSWTGALVLRPDNGIGWSYTELGLDGSFRWWIASYLPGKESHALHGIYVGPKLFLRDYTFSYDIGGTSYSTSALGAGLGAEAGYQYIFRPGLLARAGLETGFIGTNSANFNAGAPDIGYSGAFVEAVLSAGYAF
jgi:hypothetical protein